MEQQSKPWGPSTVDRNLAAFVDHNLLTTYVTDRIRLSSLTFIYSSRIPDTEPGVSKSDRSRVVWAVLLRYVCGMCAVFVRYLCGICVVFVWFLCGICAVCVRYLCGMCVVFVRYLCGICVAFVRYLCGICAVFVQYLCGTCECYTQ